MAKKVTGELYESLTGQLFEIGRQLRQPSGYPFDPRQLQLALQAAIEGRFGQQMALTAKATEYAVRVDRSRTPKQSLLATSRRIFVSDAVVDAMPRGEDDEVKLVFFKPDDSVYRKDWISCAALEHEYEKRSLAPDPVALASFAADNPGYFDDKPVGCQWKDERGNFCCAAFIRWPGERRVGVYRDGSAWNDRWSFAGVRKTSSASGF